MQDPESFDKTWSFDRQTALADGLCDSLGKALADKTQRSISAKCLRVETRDLMDVVSSVSSPAYFLQSRFSSAAEGKGAFLISARDLRTLAGVLYGLDSAEAELPDAEWFDEGIEFFQQTLLASHFTLAAAWGMPAGESKSMLINPDGTGDNLQALEGAYSEGTCVSLQLEVDARVRILVYWLADSALTGFLIATNLAGGSRTESPNPAGQRNMETDPKRGERTTIMPTNYSGTPEPKSQWNIDLILDVELPLVVSFGETHLPLKDVIKLDVGSVIELDKAVNDPVTLLVNKKPIARGEVVMVDGNYGVRLFEVESTKERIRSLG